MERSCRFDAKTRRLRHDVSRVKVTRVTRGHTKCHASRTAHRIAQAALGATQRTVPRAPCPRARARLLAHEDSIGCSVVTLVSQAWESLPRPFPRHADALRRNNGTRRQHGGSAGEQGGAGDSSAYRQRADGRSREPPPRSCPAPRADRSPNAQNCPPCSCPPCSQQTVRKCSGLDAHRIAPRLRLQRKLRGGSLPAHAPGEIIHVLE